MTSQPGLVLFTSKRVNLREIGLPRWIPPTHPWEKSVNRVTRETGKITDPFKYTLTCETVQEILSEQPVNTKTFEEQACERALEIKRLTGDSKVYLMYSGGIDSTSALVAMMQTWGSDLERLHVVMTYRSIEEFPEMWTLINKTFKGRVCNSLANPDKYYESGYVITGEHGDQIFGSDVLFKVIDALGEKGIHLKWKDNIDIVYRRAFGKNYGEHIPEFIDRYRQTLKYSPIPIRSCYDWVWWYNFTNKWQYIKYSLLAAKPQNPGVAKRYFEKIIHFYSSPSWQRWSLDNHHLKIKGDMLSYKYVAKKFIVDNTGFTSYLNKPKVGSFQFVKSNYIPPDGLDTDLNQMPLEKCLEFLNNDC